MSQSALDLIYGISQIVFTTCFVVVLTLLCITILRGRNNRRRR
jgi:hypothetical protein